MNDSISHIEIVQHVYLAVTICFWDEDIGNPRGLFQSSLPFKNTLSKVSHLAIGDNVKLS